jgi:hypothetical protein
MTQEHTMSTYNPQYISDLVNRQLSLVSQKVDAGIITNVEALDTIEPIHKHLRTVMDDIQRSIKASIDSMPTVEVVEHGRHYKRCRIAMGLFGTCNCGDAIQNDSDNGWPDDCKVCDGKGYVWHLGCGDTSEPCSDCNGTGYEG